MNLLFPIWLYYRDYSPEELLIIVGIFIGGLLLRVMSEATPPSSVQEEQPYGVFDGENPYWVPEQIPEGEIRNTLNRRYGMMDRACDKFDFIILKMRSFDDVDTLIGKIPDMAYMRDVRVLNELILMNTDSAHELTKRSIEVAEPARAALVHQIPFIDKHMRALLIEYREEKLISQLIVTSGDEELFEMVKDSHTSLKKEYKEWAADNPDYTTDNIKTNEIYRKKVSLLEQIVDDFANNLVESSGKKG